LKLSPEILELGRALVSRLSLDKRSDTLTRWMAHDIATKIHMAESNPSDTLAQAACADAILKLWEYRAVYPSGKRPYEGLEPLRRTLEGLDPSNQTPFYFRPNSDLQGDGAAWLKLALDFDATARILITYVIGIAAKLCGKAASDWSDLAEAAGLDGPDVNLARIIFTSPSKPGPTAEELERERLQGLLRSLAAFQRAAKAVAKELKAELSHVGSSTEESQH
jgi:hypothetical protein